MRLLIGALCAWPLLARTCPGAQLVRHRDPRYDPACRVQFLLARSQPRQRAHPRPEHLGIACKHRLRRVRPDRHLHRRGPRMGPPRVRSSTGAADAPDLLVRTAGGRKRILREVRALLSLPRSCRRQRERGIPSSPRSIPGSCWPASSTPRNIFREAIPLEVSIRGLADSLYRRMNWDFMRNFHLGILMGYQPVTGFTGYGEWIGYNEASIMYLLALGSPTHPVPSSAWQTLDLRISVANPLRPVLCGLSTPVRPPVFALLDRFPDRSTTSTCSRKA